MIDVAVIKWNNWGFVLINGGSIPPRDYFDPKSDVSFQRSLDFAGLCWLCEVISSLTLWSLYDAQACITSLHWVLVNVNVICAAGLSSAQPLKVDVDFHGNDIQHIYSPDAHHCQLACTQHHSCRFFTFLRQDWDKDDRYDSIQIRIRRLLPPTVEWAC